MLPAAMQAFGGQIHYIKGSILTVLNPSFVSDPTEISAIGGVEQERPTAFTNDYSRFFFGGVNSYFPGGYANHKGLAFYKGHLYQTLNDTKDNNPELYIMRYDGSGIFNHQGSDYGINKWKSGRGTELITSSGASPVQSSDLGLLDYKGHLFIAGAVVTASHGTTTWSTLFDWTLPIDSFSSLPTELRKMRLYQVFAIDKNDKKLGNTRVRITPDATNQEHTCTCDLIGYNNDLYYANWIDVLRFNGGSGQFTIIESDVAQPLSKCFGVWPSGGYIGGVPVDEDWLLMLSGDGILKRILYPSGINQLVDLTTVRGGGTSRPNDNFLARINSAIKEPGRSCFLHNYNNNLNAFVVTAASGYMHLTCPLSASGTTNWVDRTDNLPEVFRDFDGNIFGYVDTERNKLLVAHVSMSDVGAFGYCGSTKAAGGVSIYEFDNSNQWSKIYTGMAGVGPRSLVPYLNKGPYVFIPSGVNPQVMKCSDYTIINYELFDHFNRNLDVIIEYSNNNGLTWNTTRRFRTYDTGILQGSGLLNLPTSSNGTTYQFYWDYVNDIGFNIVDDIIIRITPRINK